MHYFVTALKDFEFSGKAPGGGEAASDGAFWEPLDQAQGVFLDLIAAQQVEDIAHGTPPSNAVSVKRLSARDRDRLQVALRAVTAIDALTRDLLFKE